VDRYHELPEVVSQTYQEEVSVKAIGQNLVVQQEDFLQIFVDEGIRKSEEVVIVKQVELSYDPFVGNTAFGCGSYAVKERKGIAQGTIRLGGDQPQAVLFSLDIFFFTNSLEVLGDILNRDPVEVKDLATGQDGRKDLVFFRGCQDKDGILRGLFQGLQKSIEGLLRQHVDLVYDEDLVVALLRREADLVIQLADVVHTVVGGGIELNNIEGGLLIEGSTGRTFIARLSVFARVLAVDGLGQNTSTSGLSYSTWSAEQKGVRQAVHLKGILKRVRDMALAYDLVEAAGAIFSGTDLKLAHRLQK
jgi:hypothetical protein